MDKKTMAWAAGILLVAVAFGAFGAHALKAVLNNTQLAQWHTGVTYQFYHGLGLLFLAIAAPYITLKQRVRTRAFFLAGIVLFCGSIYMLSTRTLLGTDAISPVLGPITPLGGLCFMLGWGSLLYAGLRNCKN